MSGCPCIRVPVVRHDDADHVTGVVAVEHHHPDAGTEYARIYTPIAASVGEPLQPGWPVSEVERLISRCGLTVVDHPARADLQQRYFAGRTDGLRPYTFETLVAARVA